ncbi:MAG TPA: SMC family ATPase [Nocardioides sp.]|nr:SMC family ATPase [Nocardioides sp.]
MRLHHLSVTAFGPFVETAEVDFDALCDAGLFLLSGPTGAGKSSVLDAVCFALYGAVPGDRQHAGRLRSDQAPPGLAPSVTLEAELSGRRFRIIRSPAWDRPKKRGTGSTREQARVTVSERRGDVWTPLTSRLDEAGDLLSGLLGMNLDQFCQVALLPQGQFQAFLRADSGQRHQLLARLFRTSRFERVEGWLRDHRIALRHASDDRAAVVADLVSRLSEAAHLAVPDDMADLVVAAEGALPAWVGEVRDAAAFRRTTTEATAQAATVAHETAAAASEAARALQTARSRVVAAAETVERLEPATSPHDDDMARLEQARHAEGLGPLARLVDDRQRVRGEAQERAGASLTAARDAGLDVDDLANELERVTDELASRTALLPTEQRWAELRDEHADITDLLESLTGDEELATAEAEVVIALVRDLTAVVEAADEALRAEPAAQARVEASTSVVAALDDVLRLTAEQASAATDHDAARALVVDLREQLLDLRERRIAGMAAELAGALAVGDDCPVCGSVEHPHPARSTTAQPDTEAERAAQHAVDDAQAVELALHLHLREIEGALSTARAGAGDSDREGAMVALSDAQARLSSLRARVAAGATARQRLAESTTRSADLAASTGERRLRITELTKDLEHLTRQCLDLERGLAEARGEHPELRSAVEALSARKDLVRAVRADTGGLDSARASYAEALSALESAALEAGFSTGAEARQAQLGTEALSALEAQVDERRALLTAARQILDEPDAWELLTTPEPQVTAIEAAAEAAAEAREGCRAGAQAAARTAERVHRLGDELESALADWAPLREELALATRVASFADGKAPDNRLQMRLSAYVLAHRLSQVVAAANARLAGMSDRRYSLEHVGRRGAGERRGGLSLVVRDDWSGESRDPATLSGGETFVVSLALALGLADVVAHEAGGIDLQTLCVDEGVGALDAETLDDVLDILDTLRENGRAVGVVSHVAEMRDRIPTQLVVGKARTGSTLRVVARDG